MPITIASGPDWATIMTAFGTVGAVIAAVFIAIASSKKANRLLAAERIEADRRLREQLDHSDEQLRKQQEHSDRQLEAERAAADERLKKQFQKAEELEQRSQAALVEVVTFGAGPPENSPYPMAARPRVPVVLVTNTGRYAITGLDARLSTDGRSVIPFETRRNVRAGSSEEIGAVYLGTIAPGAAMEFEGSVLPGDIIKTSFPVVRWIDYWGECWEHCKGQVYLSDIQADWLVNFGRA